MSAQRHLNHPASRRVSTCPAAISVNVDSASGFTAGEMAKSIVVLLYTKECVWPC